jgi:serine/threonine-protein kinase
MALLVVIVVAVASFQWVLGALIHVRPEVVVPDLAGKSLDQSLDLLAPMNLSLIKEGVAFDETLPTGAVLRQAPPAGMKVREGKAVRVTLSSGGERIFVPPLTDRGLPEAQNLLRAAGLGVGAMNQVYSQQHEVGWVMAQTPASGAVVRRGAMVDLKVSKGPPPPGVLLMPDFVNRSLSQAQAWLEENKISSEVAEESFPGTAGGVVQRQTPAPDAVLIPEATVRLVVSKGDGASGAGSVIRYELPSGSDRVKVRIVLRDGAGEREVFAQEQAAGSVVEVPVSPQGAARARIFVNGVLTEERPLP